MELFTKPHEGAGTERSTPCPARQHDPSAVSREKGKKPERISVLQLEGRAHWHSLCCPLPLQWNELVVLVMFSLKTPGVLGEMRITAFGIRKESTAGSSADPQERPSLREA